jgi:hypothetical protein
MERLTMMVSMQMMGISMAKGRAPTPTEVIDCLNAATDALKKCHAKMPELDAMEREADKARYGGPR